MEERMEKTGEKGGIKLEIRGLTKKYSPAEGVEDINLQIKNGELLTLLGPSGCGKTTVLRSVGGFCAIDSGSIILDGRDISALPPEKRPTAMVFQSYNLWPHMTIFENIGFGLRLRKQPKDRIKTEVERILALINMEGSGKKYPSQLSGGQQQRVAIGRALALQPALLLLDEPFSALDAKIRGQMREELKRIQSMAGLTVLFVTHDQEEAMAISERIAVMDRSRIVQVGHPTEIYDEPACRFVAEFIGQMNFVSHGDTVSAVRPEDVVLCGEGEGSGEALVSAVIALGHYAQVLLRDAGGENLKAYIPKERAADYAPGQRTGYRFTRTRLFKAAGTNKFF
ncbi:MAG: ABC transporter ATP-binding protein [Treponema sp.]|jgi:putative spermidine/putrescine transport system ATP-binding protein|nr:ABC transporter ATP-binding protein [Treponema sp.]